jgi:hypothetical protein
MKTLVVVSTLALLTACSPGHIAANKNGKAEYVWVGCHIVTENPSSDGSYVIGPLGDLPVGEKFFYKQIDNNGKVGPVTTGKPCVN